jgi:hypothetical protein
MKAVRWRKFALVTFRSVFSWTDFTVAEPYEKSRVGPCRPCSYFYLAETSPPRSRAVNEYCQGGAAAMRWRYGPRGGL